MNKRKLDSLKTKKSLSRNELKNLKGGNSEIEQAAGEDGYHDCSYTVFYCRWKTTNDEGISNKYGQCCK